MRPVPVCASTDRKWTVYLVVGSPESRWVMVESASAVVSKLSSIAREGPVAMCVCDNYLLQAAMVSR